MTQIEKPESVKPVSRLGFGGAHLDEYFGTWAIMFQHGHALRQQAERINLRLHVAQQEAAATEVTTPATMARFGEDYNEKLYDDGTAVIRVEGTLMKFSGSMSRGTGTVSLRRTVRRAKADASVQRVMLVIDSPGGTVAGTQELADDIADLASAKPTHAFVEDLMASAALWVGVQAGQISASRTSLIGSIGTLMVAYDYSGWAKKAGIKVNVITSDDAASQKGAGAMGAKITDAQLTEWRRMVNNLQAHFTAAVAYGRGISTEAARKLADARIHIAGEAKSLGLIDHVESFDEAMNRLRMTSVARKRTARAEVVLPTVTVPTELPAAVDEPVTAEPSEQEAGGSSAAIEPLTAAVAAEGETSMSQTTTAPAEKTPESKAATMAELKAACPGAASDFLVEQAEKAATVAQAKDAFIAWQGTQIRSRDEELEKTKAAASEVKKDEPKPGAKTGVEPIKTGAGAKSSGSESSGDAIAEFDRRVAAKMATGKSKAIAAQEVLSADEAFRAEYSAAVTAERQKR